MTFERFASYYTDKTALVLRSILMLVTLVATLVVWRSWINQSSRRRRTSIVGSLVVVLTAALTVTIPWYLGSIGMRLL